MREKAPTRQPVDGGQDPKRNHMRVENAFKRSEVGYKP